MSEASILLVEDDPRAAETVALYLRHAAFEVTIAPDGAVGLDRALNEPFDLVILDRMLPGVAGDRICRELRERSDVPILLVTAMVEERDRLNGFDLGADDYITKPFSPRELVARVRALLRRTQVQEARRRGATRVGALVVDEDRGEARLSGEVLELSPTEFRLLGTLARAPGRVFDRGELVDRVVGTSEVDPRVIDAHVKNLRRKLGRGGDGIVQTVFGRGYRLSRDVGV